MPTDRTKNLSWRRVLKGSGCAKQSFRVKSVGMKTVLRFCCPKGKWRSGYCSGAGMVVQAIGKRRK